MKAIETHYNGYKFRSRLEARWAVFFDALGISYQYEVEGYELSNGVKYLPDFYLPNDDMYVEVKGMREGFESELEKAVAFTKESSKPVLILTDIPSVNTENIIMWFPVLWHNGLNGNIRMSRIAFMPGGYVQKDFAVTYDERNVAIFDCLNTQITEAALEVKTDKWMFRNDDIGYEEYSTLEEKVPLLNAYLKARQARFEFNETPRVHQKTIKETIV